MKISEIEKLGTEEIMSMEYGELFKVLKQTQNTVNRRRRQLSASGEWGPAVEAIKDGRWRPIVVRKDMTQRQLQEEMKTAVKYANYQTGTIARTQRWQKRQLKTLGLTKEDIKNINTREFYKNYWELYREWQDEWGGRMTTKEASDSVVATLTDEFQKVADENGHIDTSKKDIIKGIMDNTFFERTREKTRQKEREELDKIIWGEIQKNY